MGRLYMAEHIKSFEQFFAYWIYCAETCQLLGEITSMHGFHRVFLTRKRHQIVSKISRIALKSVCCPSNDHIAAK